MLSKIGRRGAPKSQRQKVSWSILVEKIECRKSFEFFWNLLSPPMAAIWTSAPPAWPSLDPSLSCNSLKKTSRESDLRSRDFRDEIENWEIEIETGWSPRVSVDGGQIDRGHRHRRFLPHRTSATATDVFMRWLAVTSPLGIAATFTALTSSGQICSGADTCKERTRPDLKTR